MDEKLLSDVKHLVETGRDHAVVSYQGNTAEYTTSEGITSIAFSLNAIAKMMLLEITEKQRRASEAATNIPLYSTD